MPKINEQKRGDGRARGRGEGKKSRKGASIIVGGPIRKNTLFCGAHSRKPAPNSPKSHYAPPGLRRTTEPLLHHGTEQELLSIALALKEV